MITARLTIVLASAVVAMASFSADLDAKKAGQTPISPPAPKQALNIYLCRGKGAWSDLTKENYVNGLKNGPFKGHTVRVGIETDGKQEFIDQYVKSDIVYVNAHASGSKLTLSNGESVAPSEIAQGLRVAGRPGPTLVVVAGCTTLDDETTNFASATGIRPDSKGRAYIGWKGKVVGLTEDRGFRLFWIGFMTPDEHGRYRTIDEAIQYAYANGAAEAWAGFEVVGDRTLRYTNLVGPDSLIGWTLASKWTHVWSSSMPSLYGKVSFTETLAIVTSSSGRTDHYWSEPPTQLKPGQYLTLYLTAQHNSGTFDRAYTLVFYGTYSSADKGGAHCDVMIPPSMDWAGTRADDSPLSKGLPVNFFVDGPNGPIVISAALMGSLFLRGSGDKEASTSWSGKVPAGSPNKSFLLIISSGHTRRGNLTPDDFGTIAVAGAKYYEYRWTGK